jgi:hypothetical protein
MHGGKSFSVASLAAAVLFASLAWLSPAYGFPGFGDFSSALPGCAGQCHDKAGVHADTNRPAQPDPDPAFKGGGAAQRECRVHNDCAGATCDRVQTCCENGRCQNMVLEKIRNPSFDAGAAQRQCPVHNDCAGATCDRVQTCCENGRCQNMVLEKIRNPNFDAAAAQRQCHVHNDCVGATCNRVQTCCENGRCQNMVLEKIPNPNFNGGGAHGLGLCTVRNECHGATCDRVERCCASTDRPCVEKVIGQVPNPNAAPPAAAKRQCQVHNDCHGNSCDRVQTCCENGKCLNMVLEHFTR